MITSIVILMLGLFNSIIMARALGPSGRGEFAAIILWSTLLPYLGALGAAEASVYFGAQGEQSTNAVFTSCIVLTMIDCTVILPIAYFLMPVLVAAENAAVIEASRLFLLTVPTAMINAHAASLLRARRYQTDYNFIILIIPLGTLAGSLILFLLGQLTVATSVVLFFGLSIGLCLASVVLLVRRSVLTRLVFSFRTTWLMARYGILIYPGTIFSAANLRLDQVLLAAWVSPTLLGLYVVATKVSGISGVLANVVNVVAVPQIASRKDRQQSVATLERVFQGYWFPSLIIKLMLAIALPVVIPLLYGSEFQGSVFTAEVLVLASVFYDARIVLAGGAEALNNPWLVSRCEFAASILTIVMLILLLPILGILGAALTSLVAYACSMFLLVRGLQRENNLDSSKLFGLRSGLKIIIAWIGAT